MSFFLHLILPFLISQLILDRIYKGILDKVAAQGPWLGMLFDFGLEYKLNWMQRGWNTPICNWWVESSNAVVVEITFVVSLIVASWHGSHLWWFYCVVIIITIIIIVSNHMLSFLGLCFRNKPLTKMDKDTDCSSPWNNSELFCNSLLYFVDCLNCNAF